MRVLWLAFALAGGGLLAGTAAAGLLPPPPPPPPLPTTTVTVTVPVPQPPVSLPPAPKPAPLPSPPAPKPAPPTVSSPVPVPTAPKLPQPTGTTAPSPTKAAQSALTSGGSSGSTAGKTAGSTAGTSGTGASGGTSSSSAGTSSGSGPAAASGSSSSGGSPAAFSSSRPWIASSGPKARATKFVVVLRRPGRVFFLVKQVSPVCRVIGRFSVAAHAGVNRIRFSGRVHGRQLAPGTYWISAQTRTGKLIRRVTLVVVGSTAPSPAQLRSLRASNVCPATAGPSSSLSSSSSSVGGTTTGGGSADSQPQLPETGVQAAGIPVPRGPNLHSGVLASGIEKTAEAVRPLLVALLVMSIILLGLASLPRVSFVEPRLNDLLVRHRTEIAALGAAAFAAVVVAFLLA